MVNLATTASAARRREWRMRVMVTWAAPAIAAVMLAAAPARADSPRDLLTQASFGVRDRGAALARIAAARAGSTATLRAGATDREAQLMQATAIGYQAKLTGNRAEAVQARQQFEALVAREPRFADAWLALGAWHIGAVYRLGGFLGRAALGAQKSSGLAALDRSVALGGNRALFSGLAGLLRLQLDPADPRGRALTEAASHATAPTPLDLILQRNAAAMLPTLRTGDAKRIKAAASRLLPFGQLPGES
jgi:hypothetical protein